MREILDNLVENAIKYTPEGGSIYINVRGDGDRALINVTDTGIGISSEDIGHIFQKFYRADNSDTREIGGTGLGLYLVKQRVEAMGGKVWAESAFGEGSTFFVSLPRISSDEYEKRMIVVRQIQNQKKMMAQSMMPPAQSGVPMPIQSSATTQPPMPAQPAMSTSAQPNTVASTAAPPNSPTAVPVGPPVTPPVNSPITNQNNVINNLNGEKR